MRLPTSRTRYRAAIVALAGVALAAGMASVGIIVAEASPDASPAATPALIPCPDPLPVIPVLCDTPTATASTSTSATPTATASATVSTSATPTPTVSSTLSVTPTVTATHTTKPTPTPTPTSTHGSTHHPPLAGFSHESATGSHPTRVVITLVARGSKITKLTHVKLRGCKWSLGKATSKSFGKGKRQVKIVVNRSHAATKGSVSFWAVDAVNQHRVVKSAV